MTENDWQRSSFCSGGGNNCVEVAATGDAVALRESDLPADVLTTDRHVLQALIRRVKATAFTTPPRPGS